MTLEEEMLEQASVRMMKEIDFQILADMLVELGWVRVVLKPVTHEQGVHVDHWVKTYCKGAVETMGLVWLFEDPKDATWFTMKWL